MSATEVAALIGCCSRTIHNYLRDGKLPEPIRVGRFVRFHRQEIERFLAGSR